MAVGSPRAEIVVGNPDWVGDEHVGGFIANILTVSKEALALPDDQWDKYRDLYVSGQISSLRASITRWCDEQREQP